MCRVATIALVNDRRSPAQARAWTDAWLDFWEIDDEGVTTLLVSELVTNAVRHTRTTSTLTLAVAGGTIEVGLRDGGSSPVVTAAQRAVLTPTSRLVLLEGAIDLLVVRHALARIALRGGRARDAQEAAEFSQSRYRVPGRSHHARGRRPGQRSPWAHIRRGGQPCDRAHRCDRTRPRHPIRRLPSDGHGYDARDRGTVSP